MEGEGKAAMKCGCVESALRRTFRAYSRLVASFPVPLILLYTATSLILGFGIYFMNFQSNTEELFSPRNSRAKTDKATVIDLFPVDDLNTLPDRLIDFTHRRISVIVTCQDGGNILRRDYIEELLEFDQSIQSASFFIDQNETYINYTNVCIKWQGKCFTNPVIIYYDLVQYDWNVSIASTPYPDITLPDGRVTNIEPYFGEPQTTNGEVVSASAFSLNYFLQQSPDYANDLSKEWEALTMDIIRNFKSDLIHVYGFHSESLDESQRNLALSAIVYVVAAFAILVTFATVSCIMIRDYRQSKPWLGVMGVISATLALVSAVGFLCYCGVPFNQVTISMPFIILGIGLDDMFIMISAWRMTSSSLPVKERMSATYEEAAVSITITSLTDILAFCVGSISPIPGIQIFCLYTGVAVFFAYLYQITFFGAWLVLFGHMEAYNCSGVTCIPVKKIRPIEDQAFFVEHAPQPRVETSQMSENNNIDRSNNCKNTKIKLRERNHAVMVFFRDYYAKFFSSIYSLIAILLIYCCYISVASYFCSNITLGLQQANIAEEGTMTHDFLTLYAKYFKEIGPSTSVIITEPYPYWESAKQDQLEIFVTDIHDNEYIKPRNYTDFWLDDYKEYLVNLYGTSDISQDNFVRILRDDFLNLACCEKYKLDINFDGDEISSSRFLVVAQMVRTTTDEESVMLSVRNLVDEFSETLGVAIIAYSTKYVFVEQYVIIIPTTVQTLSIAVACMLVVSLLVMPNVIVGTLVTTSVASILVGVVGFMTWWQVSLESVSMFNLVLCIGFSVDFSAHVAYAFVMSDEENLDAGQKLSRALYLLGYPILQSGWSTIIGIFLLFFSASYIFRTFAKIMTLVMTLGMLHGLVFLPAAMTSFAKVFRLNCCKRKKFEGNGIASEHRVASTSGSLAIDNSVFSVD